MLHTPFFHMLAEGPFSGITTLSTSGSPRRSIESEAFLANARQARLAAGIKEWPGDDTPSRFHYISAHSPWWRPNHLFLKLAPCVSYNDHAGATSPAFYTRFGWKFLPNALAVTGLVESEGKMLISRRLKADYKKGGLHFSMGGFISVSKEPTGDPVAALLRELKEEVGLEPHEVEKITCLGIAWDPLQNKPDVLFRVKTRVPIAIIKERAIDHENTNYWMPIRPDYANHLIANAAHSVVPMGLAALLHTGRGHFGRHWFDQWVMRLSKLGEGYDRPEIRTAAEMKDIAKVDMLLGELCA